jgi:predicted acylesterase/phospholipase RssA
MSPLERDIARLARGTFREQARPVRIGLVLSGGGLRGAGHLGVLRQLVANGVPIDVIVGSSAGAIVAASTAVTTEILHAIRSWCEPMTVTP